MPCEENARSKNIGQYVVNYCCECETPVSCIHLSRMLFAMDADYKARTGRRLITEHFLAEPLGPKLNTVAGDFFAYGPEPIFRCRPVNLPDDVDERVLREMADRYRMLSTHEMVETVTQYDGAWSQVYDSSWGRGKPIPHNVVDRMHKEPGYPEISL